MKIAAVSDLHGLKTRFALLGQLLFSIGETAVFLVGPGNDPAVLNFLLLDPQTGFCKRKRMMA